jgi:hypothetical protein
LIELDGEDQIVQRRCLIIAYDDADGDSRSARDRDLRLWRNGFVIDLHICPELNDMYQSS